MFDSLEEQIKHDDMAEASTKERVLRYGIIAAVTVAIIVGLYEAVRLLG